MARSRRSLAIILLRLPVAPSKGLTPGPCRRSALYATHMLPQPVAKLWQVGFVEAPTLTADGRTLYYHQRDGERFHIYRAVKKK
jgi:hypothetical protein